MCHGPRGKQKRRTQIRIQNDTCEMAIMKTITLCAKLEVRKKEKCIKDIIILPLCI